MLGVSLYPHHLKSGSTCTLASFCAIIAATVELMGIDHVGFGSDLCQDQPDSVVAWMRNETWTRDIDYGEGAPGSEGFPEQPAWFRDNTHFTTILEGLRQVGLSQEDVRQLAHGNWLRFFRTSFSAQST